ncbi:MAG: hypothetical protein ACD_79C01002G0002 [uncultured bacterium]|nr:MAG: hypothetical protein ACD_79C01002G0002 [uncultured bacterium]
MDATVAIPADNTVHNSDRVIFLRYGVIVKSDSTPTKILLVALKDSAPEIFINFENKTENFLIISGRILRK